MSTIVKGLDRKSERDNNVLMYNKEYYQKNKEKLYKRHKEWRIKNPDKYREQRKRWKRKNPDKVKKQQNRYIKKYPEKVRFLVRKNKRRRDNAEGSHTFGEWELLKKQCGNICLCCGKKEPEIKLTEDHIIPLDKGGSDYIENIQVLCHNCNSKKHTKIIKY